MKDKKNTQDIKAINSFLEFWTKFHSIFNEIISKDAISNEDEAKFLGVRDIIRVKYDTLINGLDFKYAPRSRNTDPVQGVMLIGGIRLMSEKGLKRLNDDWRDSYIFLNSISEHLKNKRKRLEGFNPMAVFFKRLMDNKGDIVKNFFNLQTAVTRQGKENVK